MRQELQWEALWPLTPADRTKVSNLVEVDFWRRKWCPCRNRRAGRQWQQRKTQRTRWNWALKSRQLIWACHHLTGSEIQIIQINLFSIFLVCIRAIHKPRPASSEGARSLFVKLSSNNCVGNSAKAIRLSHSWQKNTRLQFINYFELDQRRHLLQTKESDNFSLSEWKGL